MISQKAVYFDTDCMSSFLWTNETNLLVQLFSGRMYLPKEVEKELSYPRLPPYFSSSIARLIKSRDLFVVLAFDVNSDEYGFYLQLTQNGAKSIGPGEAAALVLARYNNGVIASNNFKDVSSYVREFNLEHLTTGRILKDAHTKGLKSMSDCEMIWKTLIKRKRKLPTKTFVEFLKKNL
jgi:predicted nucleic acid-binding protein